MILGVMSKNKYRWRAVFAIIACLGCSDGASRKSLSDSNAPNPKQEAQTVPEM